MTKKKSRERIWVKSLDATENLFCFICTSKSLIGFFRIHTWLIFLQDVNATWFNSLLRDAACWEDYMLTNSAWGRKAVKKRQFPPKNDFNLILKSCNLSALSLFARNKVFVVMETSSIPFLLWTVEWFYSTLSSTLVCGFTGQKNISPYSTFSCISLMYNKCPGIIQGFIALSCFWLTWPTPQCTEMNFLCHPNTFRENCRHSIVAGSLIMLPLCLTV